MRLKQLRSDLLDLTGKAGFQYLKDLALQLPKRYAPAQQISGTRYGIG